jgi:hypothetical protein
MPGPGHEVTLLPAPFVEMVGSLCQRQASGYHAQPRTLQDARVGTCEICECVEDVGVATRDVLPRRGFLLLCHARRSRAQARALSRRAQYDSNPHFEI